MDRVATTLAVATMAALGAFIGVTAPMGEDSAPRGDTPTQFTFCHSGGGFNCVVDGDTAWIDGVRVRIADIDAPETHPPRCPKEARLGASATKRLGELLNAGPFEMRAIDRDTDRFGRKLRILVRQGRSLGDVLVREGLARPYGTGRQPWC